MKIDAYSILTILSILVVVSYSFNYVSRKLKIPSVLLLIACGVILGYLAGRFNFQLPFTQTLLELLGVTGLIFIVLEAALDLKLERQKLPLIFRALASALILLALTSGLITLIFIQYYDTSFHQGMLHAIPLSVISSAIAIPSVQLMDEEKKEFIVYESTFSDIIGIIAFNFLLSGNGSGGMAIINFSVDIILILLISIMSTAILIFLLHHATTQVRFFLSFAIIILTYSFSKFLHLPSLILVLGFGLVLRNFRLFNYPIFRKLFSFDRLNDVTRELKMMTAETAFIIRTFFFLLFGYSINLGSLKSPEVLLMGLVIIVITLILRFIFLRYLLKTHSTPLSLIAPRGLITILLFYSIPESMRMKDLSDGILLMVIVLTGLAMTIGLMLTPKKTENNDQSLP